MIDRAALQQRFLKLVRELPAVRVQNRLMACTDRDIALSLVGLTDEETDAVLSRIAPGKAARVREEVALEERRRVDPKHRIIALDVVVGSLESNSLVRGKRSYVRPRRSDGDVRGRR